MSKHTPGPWLIDGSLIYALMHHGFTKGEETFRNRFYAAVRCDRECPEDEAESNARLIAAAPDLLDALEALVANAESMGWNTDTARRAIAKARGEA